MKEQLLKVRSMLFPIFAALMLTGPAALFCAQRIAHIELPGWLTAEDAVYLSGGRTEVNVRAEATLDGFREGAFQEALETEIGNYIPAKASALLANAALQRCAIAVSNSLFGWEWYPTFYGSNIVSDREDDLLITLIGKKTASRAEGLERTAELYSEIARAHPEIAFYIGMPSSSTHSMLANSLRSDPIDRAFVDEHFFSKLDPCIVTADLLIDDIGEYRELYFKTDHHWQMDGGYRAYALIADEMGFADDILAKGEPLAFEIDFYGSQARRGLDTWTGPDELRDYRFDLPEFKVYSGFDRIEQSDPLDFVCSLEKYADGAQHTMPFENHYAQYFHNDVAFFEMSTVDSAERGGALLVAGDSFTNDMERLFLHNFSKVYSYNLKSGNKETLSSVIERIDDADSVLILQSFGNLAE